MFEATLLTLSSEDGWVLLQILGGKWDRGLRRGVLLSRHALYIVSAT